MSDKEKQEMVKELESLSEDELKELQKEIENLINKLNNISDFKDGE